MGNPWMEGDWKVDQHESIIMFPWAIGTPITSPTWIAVISKGLARRPFLFYLVSTTAQWMDWMEVHI